MKKNYIVIFIGMTLTISNLIANESIENSIIEFNDKPELYPPFKISLIVFLNNKISAESKKEQFLDLERFIYKTELIKLNPPEMLIDKKPLEEAFKKKNRFLISLEDKYKKNEKQDKNLVINNKISKGLPVQLYEVLNSDKSDTDLIRTKFQNNKDYHLVYAQSWYQPIFSKDLRNFIYIDINDENIKIHGFISQYKEKYLHSEIRLRYSVIDGGGFEYVEPTNLINFNNLNKDIKSSNKGFRNLLQKFERINVLSPLFSRNNSTSLSTNKNMPNTYKDLFEISEERKIEKSSYQYFDHPYFGVLLKIEAFEDK